MILIVGLPKKHGDFPYVNVYQGLIFMARNDDSWMNGYSYQASWIVFFFFPGIMILIMVVSSGDATWPGNPGKGG